MSNPRKHHFVPVVYQKNFAGENKRVQTYNKRYKKFYHKYINANLYEEDFHTYIDKQGNDNYEFEIALRDAIEDVYGKALQSGLLDDIKNNSHLSEEQYGALINLVGIQYARTKRNLIESNLKKIILYLLVNDGLKPIHKKTGLQSVINDQLKRYVYSNQSNNRRIIELSGRVIEMISKQHIAFLLAPEGSQFITSDDPAFIVENHNFVIPLSSDICMITGLEGNEYATGIITRKELDHINQDTALNASNILVAKDKQVLKEIVLKLDI